MIISTFSERLKTIIEETGIRQTDLCIRGEKPQLRFLHRDGDKIMLTAAEPGYPPQVWDMGDLADGTLVIHGVVERVEIKF